MKKSFPFGLSLCGAVAALFTFALSAPSRGSKANVMLAPPPEYIERMAIGFNGAVADTLWLRWIQDSDTCYAYAGQPVVETPTVDEHDALYNPRHKNCDVSWGFKMLDAVTKLDPKFLMPYQAGAMTLSVLVEDYEGASTLFERGLENYPRDWQLHYRAAYHFLFDRHDLVRAAQLLTKAGELGGPSWLPSLASRLYSKTGQLQLGLTALLSYRKSLEANTDAAKDVDKRIAEMQMRLRNEKKE